MSEGEGAAGCGPIALMLVIAGGALWGSRIARGQEQLMRCPSGLTLINEADKPASDPQPAF